MPDITTCLWFDTEGEEAAELYTSIFPNSKITQVQKYSEAYEEVAPGRTGEAMVVAFELDGHKFVALNGGPQFTFDEAISMQIHCSSQEEVDHYWERLVEGGEEGPCGWLKDRFGLSWQVVPTRLLELIDDPDPGVSGRASAEMLKMKKIDVAAVEAAAAGG